MNWKIILTSMAITYSADNLSEALNLALSFKEKGKYHLFRGQAQNWEVIPTIGRINNLELSNLQEKLKRLYFFFETTPTLEKYMKDVDWFYAVAQHYGIPTSYIDFSYSPEIAMYFATNSKANKKRENAVIICLNKTSFSDFVKKTNSIYQKRNVIPPYIVEINVDNLWRLQAQTGCFLFTPFHNIEVLYDFDRIIFPFKDPFDKLNIEEVYPARKSELEIFLDQYFDNERRIAGSRRFKEGLPTIPTVTLAPLEYKSYLKQNLAHPSWVSSDFEKWNFEVIEKWQNTFTTNSVELLFSYKETIQIQINSLKEAIHAHYVSENLNRKSPLSFNVKCKSKVSVNTLALINRSCNRIWEGTRNLPFTDSEIFEMISNYICLEFYETKFGQIPESVFGNLIIIEMASRYGSKTRCLVSPSKILQSFRSDIEEIIIPELANNLTSELLLLINKPNLIFDFNKLLGLFKDEIIPFQVLYNSENENPVIFYTPSQISILGYA